MRIPLWVSRSRVRNRSLCHLAGQSVEGLLPAFERGTWG